MIITFTPNPSLDRSAPLDSLHVGRVNRLGEVYQAAAGRGVNVSAAVRNAGHPTLAIVPTDASDPLADALRSRRVPHLMVPVGRRARTNLTIAHADGTSTRFHEPGEPLTPENQTALVSALLAHLPGASWLALCGSLPPGSPVDWYVSLTDRARSVGVCVAVDAHGPALSAIVAAGPDRAPDIVAPNVAELQYTTGLSIRSAVEAGDLVPAIAAVMDLRERGIPTVLATLGARGAIFASDEGLWHAEAAEPVLPVSVVGAGDAALAGYLLAAVRGAEPAQRLAHAVRYGTACVMLPGAQVPLPSEAESYEVTVHELG